MKRFLSVLAILVLFTAFACGLGTTSSANQEATISLKLVSAKRPHTTRHRPHKAAKHRRNRHHRTV